MTTVTQRKSVTMNTKNVLKMKPTSRWIILFLVLFLLGGPVAVWSGEVDQKALEDSLDELGRELEGISDQATAILKQREEIFREKLESYRDELNVQVDALEAKVGKLAGVSKDKTDQYIEIMKAKNQELMEKAQTMLTEAKREFEGHLDQTMKDLSSKIEALRKETAAMSDEGRKKLEQGLKALKESNADIQKRLKDMTSQGAESWNDIKALVFDIWKELQKTFDEKMDPALFQ